MKIYQNGDRCPCCGAILEGKSPEWLREFSELVDGLFLPPWPKLAELWEANVMQEETEREETPAP